ncbi:MAG TPA: hypothetical protein VMU10_06470, partial [Desulfomonilia bacterium]|nr:hypothetical protein [Desulfomonilia bacterium]
TVGRDYAVKLNNDYAVISNSITITADWDKSSLAGGTDFMHFTDPITTSFAGSACRKGQNDASILDSRGSIGLSDIFRMLRSHHGHAPAEGFNRDVCMHASDPLIRRSQTTGSLVVELYPDDKFRIFVTAGSAPCLTPYKPFVPAAPYEDAGRGEADYSGESYWWRHEAFHINAVLRYETIYPSVRKSIMDAEAQWSESLPAYAWDNGNNALAEATRSAFVQSDRMDEALIEWMKDMKKPAFRLSHLYWKHMARRTHVRLV